jgi:hypothetical protein
VTVAGSSSSSMGTLRAAKLWPFCVLGIDWVFTFYPDGVITRGDEVAILPARPTRGTGY